MHFKLYKPWNLAAWIWLASSLILSAAPDWAAQQKRAEKITAEYLQKVPDVRSDRFVFKTIELPQGGTLELDLRIDRPKEGEEPFPVVFFVHGGGWVNGSKTQFAHQSFELAQHGIAGVRLEYRWKSQGGMFTNVIEDVLGAIDFVRQRADELNLDFSRVGLAGGSAGGHLSAIAAQLTPECISYDGFNGLYDAFDRDNGRFGRGNYTGTTEAEKKQASALYLIKDNPPDTLLYHGTADTTIDIAQSYRFAEAIRAKGGQAEVLAFEGVGHSFFNKEPYLSQTTQALLDHVSHVFGLGKATTPKQGGKPNIIYILADDLGYGDLSCLGQEKFATPNIDALKAKGLFFSQHYSGSTVCAPSRSALMTGQHTGHTFVRGNREILPEGQAPIPADVVLLPEMLKAAGYVSGAFGKWGLGYPGSEGDPMNQGFDVFYGYNCQRLGHHYYPYHLWDNDKKVMLEANAGTAKGAYAPELIHARTLKFIEDNQDKPFFCYVATVIPHAELAAPEEYMEKFRGKFPEPKPYKGYDEGPDLRTGKYQSQPEPRTAFAAMITLLDDQVGEIVAKTEELGIADRTLIIFTSDNGAHQEGGADPKFFNSNGPFRGHKRDLYEGGVHVPMFAYWPGKIAPGTTSDLISAFWDMVPTFTELVGVPTPEGLDGVSILPTLLGQDGQAEHKYLYWEFHERGGRIGVRMGRWKGVRYNVLKQPNRPMELYDLSTDIGEQKNVAAEHPETVMEIRKIMDAARTPSELFTFE